MYATLLTLPLQVLAERLMPIEFTGQTVLHLDDGRPTACGLRFIGVQTPQNGNNPDEIVWVPDGSFMIERRGYGLVKAVATNISVKDMLERKQPKGQPFKSFWFKVEGQKATTPLRPETKGDNENSMLYVTDLESVTNIFVGVIQGKQLQFALKFEDGNDIAFYGKVNVNPQDEQQLMSCITELSDLITEDSKPRRK